jgi:hypothetical protein
MRSQKPVRLTAGKFFAVSLEGFSEVLYTLTKTLVFHVFFPSFCITILTAYLQARTLVYLAHIGGNFLSAISSHRNSLIQRAGYRARYLQSSHDEEKEPTLLFSDEI